MTNKFSINDNTETPLLTVDIQSALGQVDGKDVDQQEQPPSIMSITAWAQLAYAAVSNEASEVTIRLVDEAEMSSLNQEYRGKSGVTNVLSFPFVVEPELQAEFDLALLGDVVICHSVLHQEALEQHKTLANHYAHIITHGILHLCGYDHQDDKSAAEMEWLETKILAKSTITNPYLQ